MSFGDFLFQQCLPRPFREVQEAEGVRHRDAAFTHLPPNLFMRKPKFFGKLLVGFGFFEGIQIRALDVFYQREFQQLTVVRLPQNRRDAAKSGFARGFEAAFSRDEDVVPVFRRGKNERLQNAMLTNGGGEFFQFGFVEDRPRLARIRGNAFQRNLHHAARGGRGAAAGDERIQSFSKSGMFGHEQSFTSQVRKSKRRRLQGVRGRARRRLSRLWTLAHTRRWAAHTRALPRGGYSEG